MEFWAEIELDGMLTRPRADVNPVSIDLSRRGVQHSRGWLMNRGPRKIGKGFDFVQLNLLWILTLRPLGQAAGYLALIPRHTGGFTGALG